MPSKRELKQTVNALFQPYIASEQYQIYENSIGFVSAARITFNEENFQIFDSHNNSVMIRYDKSVAILAAATSRGVSLLLFDKTFNDFRLVKETFVFNA